MAITVYTYNDKVLKNVATDKWLKKKEAPAPIVLPPLTIRVKVTDGVTLSVNGATCTQVSSSPNIWDVTTQTGGRGNTWGNMFSGITDLIEVISANLNGNGSIGDVTSLSGMFTGCSNLTSVSLFDTSRVTDMSGMFLNCTSLPSVPLYDTSSVTNVAGMFDGCLNVESGALALYNQMSTQTNPPSQHNNTFRFCGSNTVTGAAELAQIPSSWGGTAS